MSVAVLVPWRLGCAHREAAWRWVTNRYRATHPDWEIVEGASTSDLFSRSQGILDAAAKTDADVLVVADADVWCDPAAAVKHAAETGWAIPHRLVHRLSPESTQLVLTVPGIDWAGLPLSADNPQDARPYTGHPTGTLVVVRRDALDVAPPDPRFVGWGHEDDAWACALGTLVGRPWRGAADLMHLWHPAQPRINRRVGSVEGQALYRRYQRANRHPAQMRALIEEGRHDWQNRHHLAGHHQPNA